MDEEDIAEVVSRWTGIPVSKLMEGEMQKLLRLEEELHHRVVGQDEAVRAVADAVIRARAGIKDPKRPIGSFLFLGPTGVGKTELARALAATLFDDEDNMVRLDMSEYMEKHTVARLIGAPPGYVGYDEGGQLTEAVRRKPYSVVLLDEIEKAHPDVFNVLLQVLDDGRLTDGQGRTVNFKNTVIIMTSNIGSQLILEMRGADERSYQRMRERVLEALRRQFRPEFLNRVDEVVVFRALTEAELGQIVEIQLEGLRKRLAERRITLEVTEAARAILARVGYDPVFGARPLKRAIQREVETPVARLIVAGKLRDGGTVRVDVAGDALRVEAVAGPARGGAGMSPFEDGGARRSCRGSCAPGCPARGGAPHRARAAGGALERGPLGAREVSESVEATVRAACRLVGSSTRPRSWSRPCAARPSRRCADTAARARRWLTEAMSAADAVLDELARGARGGADLAMGRRAAPVRVTAGRRGHDAPRTDVALRTGRADPALARPPRGGLHAHPAGRRSRVVAAATRASKRHRRLGKRGEWRRRVDSGGEGRHAGRRQHRDGANGAWPRHAGRAVRRSILSLPGAGAAARAEPRLRGDRLGRWLRADEQPRDRGRPGHPGDPRRPARVQGQADRRRSPERPGCRQAERVRVHRHRPRGLEQGGSRGDRARDRQPVWPQPDGDDGDRERGGPRQRRHHRLRGLHPDGRRHQSRNSGGALVDASGALIGINTAIFSQSGGSMGIGFAVPINLARQVMDQLVTRGRFTRGYIGVSVQELTPAMAEGLGLPVARGILVAEVVPNGPAARAGLQRGDVILAIDGKPVNDVGRFRNQVASATPGVKTRLTILRNGKEQTIETAIAEVPDPPTLASGTAPDESGPGLTVEDMTPGLARRLGLPPGVPGVGVIEVFPRGRAAGAGLRPGDVLQEINRQPVRSAREFARAVEQAGDRSLLVVVIRGGSTAYVVVGKAG